MSRVPNNTLLASVALYSVASVASAHGSGHDATSIGWTFDFWVVFPLLLALLLFVAGALRARAALGRAHILFVGGWLVLAGALLSPLHQAGEHSFAAHMLEHELLMLVAAPLLVAARVNGILLWAFPHAWRLALARFFLARPIAGVWRTLTEPVTATALQALALWAWHAPALFDLALAHPAWHIAQHLSFLISALLFWSAMLDPRRRHHEPAMVIGCLFATTLISGALGALMAFSSSPWYAGYKAIEHGAFGLDPTQDQQIAGLLMWVPGGLVHMAVALTLLATMLRANVASVDKRALEKSDAA
jgi:putative membrane protein